MEDYPEGENWHSKCGLAGTDSAKSDPGRQLGYVTLLILVLLATLSAYGLEVYLKAHLENAMVRREVYSRQAVYYAEGGIEWAKARLENDPDFSGGTLMIGDEAVEVEVTPMAQSFRVIAEAQSGLAKRRLEAVLEKTPEAWLITGYREVHGNE